MACILKVPSPNSAGVIIITTQERDKQIKSIPDLRAAIEGIKDKWLVGLHHNWHDFKFNYDPLFDFSMAGEDDLVEVSKKQFALIPIDACNFVPPTFKVGSGEKFWDILYVARAVYFKRIPEFFQAIRELYDLGYKYRVLFICPVPPYDPADKKTAFYKIRESYDRLFSEEEKDLFNLLTIEYRYPFPFDLDTLAFFYRSSKVFVHTADDERRCRVAAYAWASGLPVVGMDCVAGLISKDLQHPPYFYEVKDYSEFPRQLISAVEGVQTMEWDQRMMKQFFGEVETANILDKNLFKIAKAKGVSYELGGLIDKNLSIRLGRHHNGIKGPNSLETPLLDLLEHIPELTSEDEIFKADDPERALKVKGVKNSLLSRINFFRKKV